MTHYPPALMLRKTAARYLDMSTHTKTVAQLRRTMLRNADEA